MTTVAELWQAHLASPFPPRFRSTDIAGVEMVTLDADIAGCVTSWLTDGGTIDDRRWNVLATRERDLERVLPALSGNEARYCRRLLNMTVQILKSS